MRKRLVKKHKRIKRSPKSSAGFVRTKKTGAAQMSEAEKGCVALTERGITDVEMSRRETEADVPFDTELDGQDAPVPMRKRVDIVKLVCGFVVIFSLFAAAVLACFSFAVATKYTSSDDPEETEPVSDESSKVVYVKPYDDGSGILTPPELYTKCAASVVSVSVRFGSELGAGSGVGSGFVISEDGYIATAEHVVRDAEYISVITADGEEYEASVIAAEENSDIALLKVDAEGLPVVELGVSSELLTGERVYAIGTPAEISYAGTLSSGEISYPNRVISVYRTEGGTLEKRLKLIQTSVDLNRGNSGCPLFDEYGRVVGMVTMRLGADYTGIGFAIPSDGLSRVLTAMMKERPLDSSVLSGVLVYAPRLGVIGENVEQSGVYGYKITEFSDDSLANGALRVGDLIVRIDSTLVCREEDISLAINEKAPGDTVKVTVMRSGQRLSFDIVLVESSE